MMKRLVDVTVHCRRDRLGEQSISEDEAGASHVYTHRPQKEASRTIGFIR